MNRRFQRYIVRTEILSTFHTRVEYKNTLKNAIQTNGDEKPDTQPPFLLGDVDPHLIHPSLDRATHHPNGIQIQLAVSPQYTLQTDRSTDRQTDQATDGLGTPAYALVL